MGKHIDNYYSNQTIEAIKARQRSRIINERKEGIDKNDTRKNPQGLVSSLERKGVIKM